MHKWKVSEMEHWLMFNDDCSLTWGNIATIWLYKLRGPVWSLLLASRSSTTLQFVTQPRGQECLQARWSCPFSSSITLFVVSDFSGVARTFWNGALFSYKENAHSTTRYKSSWDHRQELKIYHNIWGILKIPPLPPCLPAPPPPHDHHTSLILFTWERKQVNTLGRKYKKYSLSASFILDRLRSPR